MDEFTAAVSLVVGFFALISSWTILGGSGSPKPTPAVTTADAPAATTTRATVAIGSEAMRHVREACWIHERWSVAENTHVACFDLFTILRTDEASFCGDANSFAAVVGPSIQNHSPTGEEKTRVIIRAWEYLNDAERYDTYTTVLAPRIKDQKHNLKLDYKARPLGGAQRPGPSTMSDVCGW